MATGALDDPRRRGRAAPPAGLTSRPMSLLPFLAVASAGAVLAWRSAGGAARARSSGSRASRPPSLAARPRRAGRAVPGRRRGRRDDRLRPGPPRRGARRRPARPRGQPAGDVGSRRAGHAPRWLPRGLAVALGVGGAVPGPPRRRVPPRRSRLRVALAHPATPLRVRALARELRGATLAMVIGVMAVSLAPEAIGGLAVQPQVAGLAAGGRRAGPRPPVRRDPAPRPRRPPLRRGTRVRACPCSSRCSRPAGPSCSSAGPRTRWGPRRR